MSNQRKIILKICRRAAYLLSADPAKTSRIERRDRFHYTTTERQLIARCYQIS